MRWTALFALVPFLLAIRGASLSRTIALAVLWSLASMCAGITDWLIDAVVVYYDQPPILGVAMLVGTTLIGASAEYVGFAICFRILSQRFSGTSLVLLTAATWVAAELCRTTIWFGNPWGIFGYAIAQTATGIGPNDPWLLLTQVADIGGVYAISFVLVALNAAIAECAVTILDGAPNRLLRPAIVGAVIVLLALAYGRARIWHLDGETRKPVKVALVQADLDLGSQWSEEFYGRNLREYLAMTHEAVDSYEPALLFWPENSMTFFVDREPSYRRAIGATIQPLDIELIAGAPRFDESQPPVYFNSVYLLAPNGEIEGTYDKRRLLPFAEYFPLSTVKLLRRSFGRVREFDVGEATEPLPSRAGRVGVIICNEAMYPSDSRARVRAGAEILANLSNDTWVGDTEFAEHQFRIAAIRAIEQRRDLLRASTSGPSGIVERNGRVQVRTAPFARVVLGGQVTPSSELTIYAHIGDLFAWCMLVLVALSVFRAGRPN
jgi:apolipoprotein N-acyltransferase